MLKQTAYMYTITHMRSRVSFEDCSLNYTCMRRNSVVNFISSIQLTSIILILLRAFLSHVRGCSVHHIYSESLRSFPVLLGTLTPNPWDPSPVLCILRLTRSTGTRLRLDACPIFSMQSMKNVVGLSFQPNSLAE